MTSTDKISSWSFIILWHFVIIASYWLSRVGYALSLMMTPFKSLNWFNSTFVRPSAIYVNPNLMSLTLLCASKHTLSIILQRSLSLNGYISMSPETKILQKRLNCFLWLIPSFSFDKNWSLSKLTMVSGLWSLKNLSHSCSFLKVIVLLIIDFTSSTF